MAYLLQVAGHEKSSWGTMENIVIMAIKNGQSEENSAAHRSIDQKKSQKVKQIPNQVGNKSSTEQGGGKLSPKRENRRNFCAQESEKRLPKENQKENKYPKSDSQVAEIKKSKERRSLGNKVYRKR